jgi:hypothetical protein
MTHGWLQFAVGMTAIIIAIYGVLHLAKLARIAIRGLGSLAVATLRVAKAIAFVPLHVGRVFRTRSRARAQARACPPDVQPVPAAGAGVGRYHAVLVPQAPEESRYRHPVA